MSATTRRMLPTLSWPGLAAFLPGSALARIAAYDARWRQREAVRLLDDHLLHDIGVTRADLEAALGRPEAARPGAESVPAEPGRPLQSLELARFLDHRTVPSGWKSLLLRRENEIED